MGRLARRRRACLPGLGKKQLLHWVPDTSKVLELLPETARIEDGELTLGGVRASELAERVRDAARRLLRGDDPGAGARVPRGGAGRARRLRDEGVRERRAAAAARGGGSRRRRLDPRRARVRAGGGDPRRAARLPRQQQVGRGAAARRRRPARSSCSTRRARRRRAAAAGVRRVLVRLTPGVEAVTHRSIQTAHEESKFGLAPDAAEREVERARELGLEVEGVHIHVGSQLGRVDESLLALERVLAFLERLRWTPRVLDLGGGLGVRHNRDEQLPSVADFVGPLVERIPEGVVADPRAGALARRPRGRDALPRRLGQASRAASRTPRSTAACPTTRGRSSTAPATRRCSRTARRSCRAASTGSPASTASRATS